MVIYSNINIIFNEKVLEHIGEKRTLLNEILHRKVNWIGQLLKRNCLLHDVIEGKMTKVKRVRYWKLKEEAEDKKKLKTTVHQSNIREETASFMMPLKDR